MFCGVVVCLVSVWLLRSTFPRTHATQASSQQCPAVPSLELAVAGMLVRLEFRALL